MKSFVLVVALGCLAAACVPEEMTVENPAPGVPSDPVAQTCSASTLQGLVGQPASVLATMKFGTTVRIIRPGMAVTMDYSPTRLNIEIDRQDRIARVFCG